MKEQAGQVRIHASTPVSLSRTCQRLFLGLTLSAVAGLAPGQAQSPQDTEPGASGSGPFPALLEEIDGLDRHAVYRPRHLESLPPQSLGLVAWGNGGCSDDAASSRPHLLELASHGYLVLASGRILSGPGAPPAAPREARVPGQLPPPRTQSQDLVDAIDWALAENARESSPYYNLINVEQIALSGFSCGGLQALEMAEDPRVATLLLHNTGILNEGPSAIPGMALEKSALDKIHGPTLYILGGESDIAYVNGMDDFQRIEHVPVAVANLPVGHGGTFMESNGGRAAQVAVNWLQWQLRGDDEARRFFVGDNCGLCTDTDWDYQHKGLE